MAKGSSRVLLTKFEGESKGLTKAARDASQQVGKYGDAAKRAAGSADQHSTAMRRSAGASSKATSGMGGLLGKLGLVALAMQGATKAVEGFGFALEQASRSQQSVGSVAAVFQGHATQIEKAAAASAKTLGLSANAYRELAAVVGAGLKNKGITDFAGQTQMLLGLGADLAAQYGGSTKEAVEALASAMRGESDPIERYGVTLSESAVTAELVARKQSKLTGAALEQAKAQARLNILMRQTKDAQGAAAREHDTYAARQQQAAAKWEDIAARMGDKFLPAATAVSGWISDQGLPALEGLVGWLTGAGNSAGGFFQTISSWLGPFGQQWGQVSKSFADLGATLVPIFEQVGAKMAEVGQQIAPEVKQAFTDLGEGLRIGLENLAIVTKGITEVIGGFWRDHGKNILDTLGGLMRAGSALIGGMMNAFRQIMLIGQGLITGDWSKVLKGWRGLIDGNVRAIKGVFGGMWQALQAGAKIALAGLGKIWGGLEGIFRGPADGAISIINGLVVAYNQIAGAVGLPKINQVAVLGGKKAGSITRKKAVHASRGAIIPGYSTAADSDSVPLWARPGEGIIVSEALRDPRERARLLAINRAATTGHLHDFYGAQGYAAGGLVRPVPGAWTTYPGHKGIDFPVSGGTPIHIIRDGTVSEKFTHPSWGNYFRVAHPQVGYTSAYAHMMAPAIVTVGQRVTAGQVGGYVGTTGNSTGNHLHFEIWLGGSRVFPAPYLDGAVGVPGGAKMAGQIQKKPDTSAITRQMQRANGLGSGGWAHVAAKFPKLLGDGMIKRLDSNSYDQGGILPPGPTLAVNNTSRPERILTEEQWQALTTGREITVIVNGADIRAAIREEVRALASAASTARLP